ncbi:MAG: diacylglycerol kinase family protein [Minisyncoccia bacterium]
MKLSFKKWLQSLKYSFQGIKYALNQQNFFLIFVIAIIVIILGFYFNLSFSEGSIVILTIGLVLSLEALNTIWEKTLDLLQPYFSPKVKDIKNLVAGAVVIACLTSLVIGLIIFLPKILLWKKIF